MCFPAGSKNTAHSLALPFLRLKHLPFKIALIVGLLLYAKWKYNAELKPERGFYITAAWLLGFIALSFFLPCFLLSDVVPDRAASLAYLAGVFFLFDQFILKKIGNPNALQLPAQS
jgi:hypothetical protein